jgi:hypothetical protein
MIAAPVQCDVDGIPKGSHYVRVPIATRPPNEIWMELFRLIRLLCWGEPDKGGVMEELCQIIRISEAKSDHLDSLCLIST